MSIPEFMMIQSALFIRYYLNNKIHLRSFTDHFDRASYQNMHFNEMTKYIDNHLF